MPALERLRFAPGAMRWRTPHFGQISARAWMTEPQSRQ
jgi:hypothetical protein